MRKKNDSTKLPPLVLKAEKALKQAVLKTLLDHERTGDPVYIWKNGKVVKVPANKIHQLIGRKK